MGGDAEVLLDTDVQLETRGIEWEGGFSVLDDSRVHRPTATFFCGHVAVLNETKHWRPKFPNLFFVLF